MTVTGTAQTGAEVHFEAISLYGPEVVIDQPGNAVAIDGAGKLIMPAQADPTGTAPTRPTELGGHAVGAGDVIITPTWVVHRDPRWFEEPLVFRPERWAGDFAQRLPRFAYMPFGGGPRLCIGHSFAMTEATLLLAAIAGRFRLHTLTSAPPALLPSITLRPRHGLAVCVEAG